MLLEFHCGLKINLHLLMIYHTMRTWYTQFRRTRPYTQIHSLTTKIPNIKITPKYVSFVLLSVNNLALQLIKLV